MTDDEQRNGGVGFWRQANRDTELRKGGVMDGRRSATITPSCNNVGVNDDNDDDDDIDGAIN